MSAWHSITGRRKVPAAACRQWRPRAEAGQRRQLRGCEVQPPMQPAATTPATHNLPRAGEQPAPPTREMIAILDFGSQYSHLIARRVRECRVFCELLPASTTLDELRRLGAKGVILSGGPDSVYDPGARRVDQAILENDLPILGICYGMQLLANQLGGRVEPHGGRREYGPAEIFLAPELRERTGDGEQPATLFSGLVDSTGDGYRVWMSHGDS